MFLGRGNWKPEGNHCCRYKLCDYVAIMPRNKRGLVDSFLVHFGLNGDSLAIITPRHAADAASAGLLPLKIPQPISVRDMFESYLGTVK